MRLLIAALALLPGLALAGSGLIPYGAAQKVILKARTQADPPDALDTDPTLASATCVVVQDGTGSACAGTLAWIGDGFFSYTFTTGETDTTAVSVSVIDDDNDFLDVLETYETYNNDSAALATLGTDQNWTMCIDDAPGTCVTAAEILCVVGAYAAGRSTFSSPTWTVYALNDGLVQDRITAATSGEAVRNSVTLDFTDCK